MKRLRKRLALILLTIMIFNVSTVEIFAQKVVQEDNKISEAQATIIINETTFQSPVKPIIKNGRILAPLRALFEAMSINVQWDSVEKIVYATKDNATVMVSINSNIAFVNEIPVELDQSAIIYNDSTYVPLRFIGEAFGGSVDWNQDTRTATIKTNFVIPPKIQEFRDMSIFVDKKKVNTSLKPITRNGVGMIPAEPVFKAMGVKSYQDYVTGEMVGIKNDIELRISMGEKTATVNGLYIEHEGEIMDYKESLYIPLKMLEQIFNATVVWNGSAKEVSIYNKEASFALNFLEREFVGGGVVPSNVPEPTPEGNTRLMVSDNPETFNEKTVPVDAATLWQDIVEEDEEYVEHIVFGYHENKFNEPVTIGITIENLSNTNDIELVSTRGVARTSSRGWAIYDVGLKVAELSMSDQLPIIPMSKTALRSRTSQVIDDFYVSSGNLIGFQYEFKVKKRSGTGKLNYIVRTVVSKNERLNLTSIKGEPLPLDQDNKHPRGAWPFANLTTELPTYEAGTWQTAYSISNRHTDNIFSAEESFGQEFGTVGNIGHYGATYKIKIPVVNNTGDTKTIRVRLNPRGGRCAAAVKTSDGVFITPEMNSEYAAIVMEHVLEDGEEEVLEFEMMNAGGSSLPIAINIITL